MRLHDAHRAFRYLHFWQHWARKVTGLADDCPDPSLRNRIAVDLQELQEWRRWAAALTDPWGAPHTDDTLRTRIANRLAEQHPEGAGAAG